jgi:hypothetical protein
MPLKLRRVKGCRKRADQVPGAALWWLENGCTADGNDADAWLVSNLLRSRRGPRPLDPGGPPRAGLRAADRCACGARAVSARRMEGRMPGVASFKLKRARARAPAQGASAAPQTAGSTRSAIRGSMGSGMISRSARVAVLVVALLLEACAPQIEYVLLAPECMPPPQPALPVIMADELAQLPDDVYWRLADRERRLADWAFEMHAMLGVLCTMSDIDQAAPST